MIKTWFTGGAAKQHPKRKAKDDSPKNVEEFIEVCPNLDPEDAENLRKEDESSKREERKLIQEVTRDMKREYKLIASITGGYCMRV
jgi:hypothetical protein